METTQEEAKMLEKANAFDLMEHNCFCIILMELESSSQKIKEKVE